MKFKNIPTIIRNIYYYKVKDNFEKIKSLFSNKGKGDEFDKIYKKYINNNKPIIFDVGAYNGKSIVRFKKILCQSAIHSFEPSSENYQLLSSNFGNEPSITLNNVAVGPEKGKIELKVNAKKDTSSVFSIDQNHKWAERRCAETGVSIDKFLIETEIVNVVTLDEYIQNKNIERIDILKIDTQGFELGVLNGSQESIKAGIFDFIEIEILLQGIYTGAEKNILDIEKLLIPNDYKLVTISSKFNLDITKTICFDAVYVKKSIYDKILTT